MYITCDSCNEIYFIHIFYSNTMDNLLNKGVSLHSQPKGDAENISNMNMNGLKISFLGKIDLSICLNTNKFFHIINNFRFFLKDQVTKFGCFPKKITHYTQEFSKFRWGSKFGTTKCTTTTDISEFQNCKY